MNKKTFINTQLKHGDFTRYIRSQTLQLLYYQIPKSVKSFGIPKKRMRLSLKINVYIIKPTNECTNFFSSPYILSMFYGKYINDNVRTSFLLPVYCPCSMKNTLTIMYRVRSRRGDTVQSTTYN